MTKAEVTTKPLQGRTRGPYSAQACDQCRRKKIKCNGTKPVCGSCESSKRSAECSWTGENVRVPRTEAHFEALRKRVEALQAYVDSLESMLEQCRQEHGGVSDVEFKQLRPVADQPEYDPEDFDEVPEGDIMQELAMSAENLKLEDRNLVVYGNVAPFRFAPAPSQVSRFNQIIDNPNAHYVLLVDGTRDYSPTLDWSKHLPKSVRLCRREHDKLIPALFLRDMYRNLSSNPPPDTSHYSPMLHNALIALATAFSDDPRLTDIQTRTIFATTAKNYIEHECQKPNICVVQALSLLGSFHSSKGDQNLGYLYFGMSIRVAEILGLSVDSSKWVKAGMITHDDMLDRNWAHWTSFSLDVCWSLYVGRDCSFVMSTSSGHSIPVPFVDADFDEIPWHYKNETTGVSIPPQPNYLSRTFAKTCELLVIARKIMEMVNGMHHPSSTQQFNDEVISRLDLQLNTWKGGLSPEVDITLSNRNSSTPHKLMMHLIYWLCFILLHRPFFLRKTRPGPIYSSDREIDHVKLCRRAAENIMDHLSTWQRLYGLRYTPVTLFQAVFSAGTIFLLLAVQAASPSKPRLAKSSLMNNLSQVELCIQYLKEVGKSWQSANDIADILGKLAKDRLKPLLERNMIGSDESKPMQQQHPHKPASEKYSIPPPPSNVGTGMSSYTPTPVSTSSSSVHRRPARDDTQPTISAWTMPLSTPNPATFLTSSMRTNYSRAGSGSQSTGPVVYPTSQTSFLLGGNALPSIPHMPQLMEDYICPPNFDYGRLLHELGISHGDQTSMDLDGTTVSLTPEESAMLEQFWK